jgi:integrase
VGKLSARTAATAKAGRHGDGQGLWLAVAPSGAKKWVYRYSWQGRVRETGLGGAGLVTLAEAREKAQECRLMIARGINPVEAKRAAAAAAPAMPTFGKVADMIFAAKSPAWSKAHAKQWRESIARHAGSIHDVPISHVDLPIILTILEPIWFVIPETARRVRTRLEEILDFAQAHAWRSGSNPARLKGNLAHILRHKRIERTHFAAMPYADLPDFIANLRAQESIAARALEFLILVAGRSAEGRCALVSEISFDERLWTIGADRMKSRRSHRVPLPHRAMAIVEAMRARNPKSDFIFPSAKPGAPISYGPLYRLLPPGVTLHGFRSAFRDFAADHGYERELAEEALAHTVGSETERAYRRTDLLQRRRGLMDAWAQYLDGCAPGNVISIAARK